MLKRVSTALKEFQYCSRPLWKIPGRCYKKKSGVTQDFCTVLDRIKDLVIVINNCERMGLCKELTSFEHGTVIQCY